MRKREREKIFMARKQSSHELILAAKASNGGGHCSCSTDTTPDRGSGWPRLRGSGGVPVRARGHSVGALRGRQSPELIRQPGLVLSPSDSIHPHSDTGNRPSGLGTGDGVAAAGRRRGGD